MLSDQPLITASRQRSASPIIAVAVALTGLLSCGHARAVPLQSAVEEVTVQTVGNAIHYRGPITADGLRALGVSDLAVAQDISWLVIDSAGGEVNLAMDLGDWVYAYQLNVRITDRCLSACANYVFSAAQVKVIEPGAIVAWHGSAIQSDVASRMAITDIIDRDILPHTAAAKRAAVKQKLIAQTLDYLARARSRQSRFFAKIGVDERITTLGEDHPAVRDFWFLSVAVMAGFGIDLVVAPSDYAHTDTTRFGNGAIVYLEMRP